MPLTAVEGGCVADRRAAGGSLAGRSRDEGVGERGHVLGELSFLYNLGEVRPFFYAIAANVADRLAEPVNLG